VAHSAGAEARDNPEQESNLGGARPRRKFDAAGTAGISPSGQAGPQALTNEDFHVTIQPLPASGSADGVQRYAHQPQPIRNSRSQYREVRYNFIY